MVSTDGSRDDEAREEGAPDESVLPPGPRRSTYTPPLNQTASIPMPVPADDDRGSDEPVEAAPPLPPRPSDDLPAFIPPPPPAPDFEFLKPETGPVNVVYQLDDIEPNLPFDVAVETLAQSPAGARILPKEPAAEAAPAPAPVSEPVVVAERAPIVIDPIIVSPVVEDTDDDVADGSVDEAPPAVDDVDDDGPIIVDPIAEPIVEADSTDLAGDDAADAESGDAADVAGQDELSAEELVTHEPVADEAEVLSEAVPLPDFYEAASVSRSTVQPPTADMAFGAESEDPDDKAEASWEPEVTPVDTDAGVDDAPVLTEEAPSDNAADDEPNLYEPAYDSGQYDEPFGTEPESAEPESAEPESAEPDFDEPEFAEPADDGPSAEEPPSDELIDGERADDEPDQYVADPIAGTVDEPVTAVPSFDELFSSAPRAEAPASGEPAPAAAAADDAGYEEPPAGATSDAPESGPSERAESSESFAPGAESGQGTESGDHAVTEPAAPAALSEAEQLAALSQQGAPAGRPWVPERRSLKDAELSSLLTGAIDLPNGTLGVMEELERQLQLRDEETREFQEWQDSMLAVGTPEAIAAVEKVLPEFTDIVPPATAIAIAAAASTVPPATAPPVDDAPTADAASTVAAAPPTGPSITNAPPPMGSVPSPAAPPLFVEPSSVASWQDEDSRLNSSPVYEDSITSEERDAIMSAPPPLVEPPAPAPAPALPGAWAFDDDTAEADDASASGEPADVADDKAEDIAPAPSKYAPTPPAEASIFIAPVPVPTSADTNAPALVEPGAFAGTFVDPVYTGPLTGSVSISTGGISIPPEELDTDIDDPLDEIDQAKFEQVFGASPATAPVLVTRIPDDEVVLNEPELTRPRVFSLEAAGAEPTPEEQRVGRAARMFWLWFAANASVASIAFGGVLFSLGLSLRQAIVAVLAGVAVSFLPLGLGTLAGKRSGQPTMVVSRAAFGLSGNALPAAIAVISRVFWGSALLWILGQGVASVLDGAGLAGPLSRDGIAYLVMAGGLVIALAVAVFGYGLIVVLQLVSSIVSAILIAGLIVLTWQHVDVGIALTHPDGSWMLAGTAAVLVFSFIGLLWANSSGDLARYQRPGSSSPGSMLSTSFGATIPTFVLISYGALLAASNTDIAAGLVSDPFDTIGGLLPLWYPAPLIVAIVLGLLSAVVISIYSGGYALTAVGVRLSRLLSAVVIAGLIAVGAVALVLVGTDYSMLFRDLATTLAVPVAAWTGIFAADAMIRQRTYDTEALLARGGVYPAFNWVNLSALVVIIGVGFGLTTATVAGLTWQGYLFPLVGLPVDGAVAGTDLGVIVALVLGLLTPIVAGIPTIRKQEASPRRTG